MVILKKAFIIPERMRKYSRENFKLKLNLDCELPFLIWKYL